MNHPEPWEHPDWYDLHDTTLSAGSVREPEHYEEALLALPPLDKDDHLYDLGAGTGKLACLIGRGYPRLGRVTLVEPNKAKLDIACERLAAVLPKAKITGYPYTLGEGMPLAKGDATIITIGSVLMVMALLRGGTLSDGLAWIRASLADVYALLTADGWVYVVETIASLRAQGGLDEPARRLTMRELTAEFERAGFAAVECVYRFRDRVVIKAQKPRG